MILKMQSGGGMPPFTYYKPIAVNTQQPQQVSYDDGSSTKASAKNGSSDELDDKDLLEMLGKIDGLPSDMNKVYDMMKTFYKEQELGISTSSLSSAYLLALQYLKTAKFNKEQFDNSYKTVSKNGGLNEVAINETGHIIARDKDNNIKYLTADDYINNRDKYMAFTNQDLLQIRAEDPDYAYKNGLFNAVNNGIGLSAVDKLIQQYMTQLGENEITNGGYVRNKGNGVIQGVEALQTAAKQAANAGYKFDASGITLEGLYKTKTLTKEQYTQAKHALSYIYQMLPDNAKTLLKVKTGSDKGAVDLITNFITGQTSSTYEFTPDMEEDEKGRKVGSKSSESNPDDKINNDPFVNIIRGEGGTQSTYNMMDMDGRSYQVNGTAYPSLSRDPSKPIKAQLSLSDLMSENGLNGITPGNGYAITFGSTILSSSDMEDVVAMNDGKAVRAIIPVKSENGQVVPDLDFIKEHSELMDLINSKKQNMDDPEVQKALVEAGVINPYTGLPDMSRFRPYLCVNGLATSRNIKEPNMVHELTGDKLDSYVKIFENTLYEKEGDQGKARKYDFDTFTTLNPLDWFGNYDRLYNGTIFIPLTQNALQAGSAAGTTIKQSQADEMETTYQKGELMTTANPTSSNLLGDLK